MSNAGRLSVLVSDSISAHGIELLQATPGVDVTVKTGMSPGEFAAELGKHDALIVRSATKVTADALRHPGKLRVIGRAGTGVDNIDLNAATQAGVVVINTPGGNSVAAAEHTFSLLLSLARNVAQSNRELREGRWERKKYMGVEVQGKTIGIVGLGRIGREVARRAQGFRMEVLGYDPFVSAEVAADIGIRTLPLKELVAESDFVTLHLPVSNESRHLIDKAMLARFKKGARVINCARGGLIDEVALLEALESGQLGGAALDVFETEPPEDRRLIEHPLVVCTPHLGASTQEAQERVGTEIAEKIVDFLQNGVMLDAVNFPAIGREQYATLGPAMELAAALGCFVAQIAGDGFRKLTVRADGEFGKHPLKPLSMAAAKGLLTPAVEGSVSYVNSLALASERGLAIEETRGNACAPYAGLLRLTLATDRGETTVAGTLVADGLPRIVEVDGMPIESTARGHMLFLNNRDVPGVVGRIGTLLGNADVNIAGIHLGRTKLRGDAVSILLLDNPVPTALLETIRGLDDIVDVRQVSI